MRTRLTAAVLSGLMVFGLAACSSDAADDTGTDPATTATDPLGDTGTTGDTGATTDPLTDPAATE